MEARAWIALKNFLEIDMDLSTDLGNWQENAK